MLSERILIIDGAMGSVLQGHALDEADFRGNAFKDHPVSLRGDLDLLSITQPDLIEEVHRQYLDAGADIIETNTFNATAISQADYGLQDRVYDINVASAKIAKRAAAAAMAADPVRPRFVAGILGPTTRSASVASDVSDPAFRSVTFDELAAAYGEQARGLLDGGADLLLVETQIDTLNLKAALYAINTLFDEGTRRVPLMASFCIVDASGRTLSGQTVEACWTSIRHGDLYSVGINCALGATELRPYIEELSGIANLPVTCYPNAGLPNELGGYDDTPDHMAEVLGGFAEEGWLNMVGGCCGTTPAHIAAISEAVRQRGKLRVPHPGEPLSRYSGLETFTVRPDSNFTMIGERTNVTGSRKFARLVRQEKYEEALGVARQQIEGGANIIDVNMDEGLLDSERAMTTFLNLIASEPDIAATPVMIDSSSWPVIEAGLKCVQGKSIANSISLKEGEEVFKTQARVAKRYGAAVVVMAFDEDGQATDTDRKVEILSRSYRILTEEIGMDPTDIIFDPNILTVATGIEEHDDYAVNFIEAVRRLKALHPLARVSGGVSNISFSFRGNDPIREAMHAAFLYHAIQAGLDMGIVNAGQLAIYEDIEPDTLAMVEDVLLNRRPDATERLLEFAASRKGRRVRTGAQGRGLAQRQPGRTYLPRPGQRYRRPRRGGHGRSPATLRPPAAHHRGTSDGRDVHRRRSLPGGEDVPAAGGQERPGHEKGRGPPCAAHGSRARRRRGETVPGDHPPGHGEGGRARHREEHRGRGARVQQLPHHRPGRHGPGGEDHRYGRGRRRRPHRIERADHPVPPRDDPRGPRGRAQRLRTAPAHRRRHDEPQTHGDQDRAGLSRADRARDGRVAGRGSRRQPPQRRFEVGLRPGASGRTIGRSAKPTKAARHARP